MQIIIIIIIIAYPTFFALRNSHQFKEAVLRHVNIYHNKAWHTYQAAVQILYLLLVMMAAGGKMALIAAFVYWLVFDSIVAKIGLDKPIYYLGTTGTIDKIGRRIGQKTVFILKVVLLVAAIIFYFIEF